MRILSAASILLVTVSLPLAAQRRDFPTRPTGDPAAIERGRALYSVNWGALTHRVARRRPSSVAPT